MTKPDNDLRSCNEAAKGLGISPQAAGQWAKRPGAPVRMVGGRVRFEWPAFARWREDQMKRERQSRARNRSEADDRLASAKAEMAELELEEARGNLARKGDVQRAWRNQVERFLARIRSLPAKAAPALVGAKKATEVQVLLEEYVEEVVAELRDYGG